MVSKKSNPVVGALKYSFTFVAIFWLIEFVQLMGFDLSSFGILPRSSRGLLGILTSPFIHGDHQHLIANTVLFFVLCSLLILFYKKRATSFLLLIWIVTGVFTWLIGRQSWHIGASGVIYGLAFFLVFGGILSYNWKLILVSVVVIGLYSGLIWGVFPSDTKVSWEGHLSGTISGIIVAFMYKQRLRSAEY